MGEKCIDYEVDGVSQQQHRGTRISALKLLEVSCFDTGTGIGELV